MGGRARPERPGEAVLSLRCEGHQCIPQGLGLLGHRRDLACTVLRFIRVEALLDISAPVLQQAIDEPREFVRRRRDGLWGCQGALSSAERRPPRHSASGAKSGLRGAGRR